MTNRQFSAPIGAAILAGLFVTSLALAQPSRITRPLDTAVTSVLGGNRTPRAHAQDDQGPLDASQRLSGITLVFRPSASQRAELERLLEEQRNPSSPNYHDWLTPEQYADRFGMSRDDVEKVVSWLESEGLDVRYVARSRTWISFSGTAAQLQKAFHTEFHRYNVRGQYHFANTTDPSVPAALESVILLIRGLDDFRAEPNAIITSIPDFTSSGSHSLVPGDIATIYDIGPLYQNGITGGGEKIAVVGQTDIYLSDIEHFRSEFGLPANNPQLVLVTGSPDPGVSADDLIESSLDLEYAGGIAPNATILFVYSTDVYNSAAYVIDQALAPVISMSYGYCEPEISSNPVSTGAYFTSLAQQGNAMGITWLASSGDSGAADCDVSGEQVATQGLAVNLPASVPEITAVGGSEFMDGSGSYWSSSNNSNGSSALSYIPEMAWNDTATQGTLAATGGGASVLFAKPAWQSGVGVPNDNARDVPDISFSAALHDPYQIYANGTAWLVGGTSASTPVFSGVLALLNQYLVASGNLSKPGLGNVNPTLYQLAATPGVFHDITTGNNIVPCANGSPNCSNGELGYSAGVGYDRTTGLGSADVYKLVTLWDGGPLIATTTTLGESVGSINPSGSTLLTATVSAASGSTSPAGSVAFTVGQTVLGNVALSGSGGVATAALQVNASQLSAGANTIQATYSGSASFSGSSASVSVTVTGLPEAISVTPSSGSGTSQTFNLQYSDPNGASSLQRVAVWFDNSTSNSAGSCVIYYTPGNNEVNLFNDASTATTEATPGTSTTLQNSQCSVNLAATTVTTNGNTLTLNVPITFQPGYTRAKYIYMQANDVSGSTGGWQQMGSWSVPAAGPALGSVTPNSGSGTSQTFTLQYSDTNGASSLQRVAVWFDNSTANSAASCVVYYTPANNEVNLFNDASTATTEATPGTSTTLQNSQCSVNVATTTVTTNGDNLTLSVPITFQASYSRSKYIYMQANDSSANTGWQQMGSWSVSGSGPAVVSVTPNSGSGTSQTFTLQYSDTNGASSLQRVAVWFDNSTANSAGSCVVYYTPANNEVNLFNDASTATTQATPGTSATLQNSQCSVNVAETSLTTSGNNLTLNLAMTFQDGYARAKYIYMQANDVSGATSGWQQMGSWTVSAAGPAVVSVTPNSGSGTTRTFTLEYYDTDGASSLQRVAVWFDDSTSDSAGSCLVYYTPANNELNLFNDASSATTQATPGTSTALENSQCSVNVAATTVTMNGDTLTLNAPITFQPGYARAKYIYMQANDISGATSGWEQLGAWSVAGAVEMPMAVSLTPNFRQR